MGAQPRTMKAQSYLYHLAMPQVGFHTTTAYDMLRQVGVNIGKRDYLGSMPSELVGCGRSLLSIAHYFEVDACPPVCAGGHVLLLIPPFGEIDEKSTLTERPPTGIRADFPMGLRVRCTLTKRRRPKYEKIARPTLPQGSP
jgi:hypothetical protein